MYTQILATSPGKDKERIIILKSTVISHRWNWCWKTNSKGKWSNILLEYTAELVHQYKHSLITRMLYRAIKDTGRL